jgi:Flp pilus assembly protein TadD
MLVTASVYLCLCILKAERPGWMLHLGFGACLGAALLTKATGLLAVPVMVTALIWRSLQREQTFGLGQITPILAALGICLTVCSWHYARAWIYFGNPLIGVWDPRTGYSWWQQDGFRTAAFYTRLGDGLMHPWFSSMRGFVDGIYTTLWGDGLCGGAPEPASFPPWNYQLMALGYWFALVPSLALLVGGLSALARFIRQPSPEWFLLLGLAVVMGAALVHLSLTIPYYCTVKAFYGLAGVAALCAFAALGLESLTRWAGRMGWVISGSVGLWAAVSFASFWIVRSSSQAVLSRACGLYKAGHEFQAAALLQGRLNAHPQDAVLRSFLVTVLLDGGDTARAAEQAQVLLTVDPTDAIAHVGLAAAQTATEAIAQLRQFVRLSPQSLPVWQQLSSLLLNEHKPIEAAQEARTGLGGAPFSADLHETLGLALCASGRPAEGVDHLRLAATLRPQRPDLLNNLAWALATSAQSELRDGPTAVHVAERACALTGSNEPVLLGTLAAAYAEAARFGEAVTAATKARDLAQQQGLRGVAQRNEQLIDLFKTHQPYRE